jgi:EAL domain-containing protein (putative c-di-GMP-specific phosphodiesterase class I)
MVLYFLPIVNLDGSGARGAEALIRWEHPEGGLLLPDDFLPAVAHTAVMREVTRWVLHNACLALKRWPGWSISVNVAARDVTDPGLVADVSEVIAAHAVDPRRLTLELTEHAMVSDLELAIQVLSRLRELGVGLSLDDFGTGYSSLLYLRELPLTEVKIDRTFVTHLTSRPDDAAIVESVVRLARTVGLGVVAEGVENSEQVAHLRLLGCGAGQGYLWGRPRPAPGIDVELLDAWQPTTAGIRGSTPHTWAPPPGAAQQRIHALVEAGASLHTIAAALNREGLKTSRATRWTATSVAKAITSLR